MTCSVQLTINVPLRLPNSYGRAKLRVIEDNDAMIRMMIKERSPQLRCVARTHRVDLDWFFERPHRDAGVFIQLVGTEEQLADILTN